MKKITTIILFSFLCITSFSQEMRRKQVIDYSFDAGVLTTGLAMNKTGIADDKILHFYAGYFGSNCIQFFADKSNLSDNAKEAINNIGKTVYIEDDKIIKPFILDSLSIFLEKGKIRGIICLKSNNVIVGMGLEDLQNIHLKIKKNKNNK